MKLAFFLLMLVSCVGFILVVPPLFRAIAKFNASIGFPEMQNALPLCFKVGFWIAVVSSIVNAVAFPFRDEELPVAVLQLAVAPVLALRFWYAAKVKNDSGT